MDFNNSLSSGDPSCTNLSNVEATGLYAVELLIIYQIPPFLGGDGRISNIYSSEGVDRTEPNFWNERNSVIVRLTLYIGTDMLLLFEIRAWGECGRKFRQNFFLTPAPVKIAG